MRSWFLLESWGNADAADAESGVQRRERAAQRAPVLRAVFFAIAAQARDLVFDGVGDLLTNAPDDLLVALLALQMRGRDARAEAEVVALRARDQGRPEADGDGRNRLAVAGQLEQPRLLGQRAPPAR